MLAEFAATTQNPRVAAVHRRHATPASVAVRGRAGVGRKTVAAALASAGVRVVADGPADVTAVVVAETVKPEDAALLRDAAAALLVLNKADLTGAGPGGPLAAADRRAAELAAAFGCPAVPTAAHLAVAELDETLAAALRRLIDHPADMTSVDAFVTSDHPLPGEVRGRLLATLDRFGIAHAVLAAADGASTDSIVAGLRRLSGVERVVAALRPVAAPARYRAVCAALRELRILAVRSHDEQLERFLAGDDAVVAVMAAAVEVVEATGATVDRGDDPGAHLRRAVHWRRCARGPFDRLHAACAADISRGSLRLLARTS
ncbi:hypothetical protein MDUV_40980 [Mycolicibacterium duvalii]|uniref:Uncharacterized protein n=1 Tax=Mycolicibacterium duvalii TaxID=39688 RepID=A0A7I7K6P9_9MYCO|nr:hypothetical protein [Mycolicibacterium duvalii]BBX19238.1 hypothetical protein MDUV_40980 [Mycolicibacterium duvalii]